MAQQTKQLQREQIESRFAQEREHILSHFTGQTKDQLIQWCQTATVEDLYTNRALTVFAGSAEVGVDDYIKVDVVNQVVQEQLQNAEQNQILDWIVQFMTPPDLMARIYQLDLGYLLQNQENRQTR